MKNKIKKAVSISVIVLILFSLNIAATVETHAADMSYTVDGRNVDIDIDKVSVVSMEGAGAINHNNSNHHSELPLSDDCTSSASKRSRCSASHAALASVDVS